MLRHAHLRCRERDPIPAIGIRRRATVVHEEIAVRDDFLWRALELDIQIKFELFRVCPHG